LMRVVKVLTDPLAFVRLMVVPRTITDPSSLVTTWVPDGVCCVMVAGDFFEQLTDANVIRTSAISDA
jgi:hypothetical protein